MKNQVLIPSVNFHLWEPCNMRCRFCFATFQDVKKSILPKGHLPKEEAIEVVKQLGQFGFEKITFAGGEPTLCPWLGELIITAKSFVMTTMIVTNGSRLSTEFLETNRESLDWIALSIDSMHSCINLKLGRAIAKKKEINVKEYKRLVKEIKRHNYGFKINTVVNRLNLLEDFSKFIKFAKPSRWKVLQVMPVIGQNDEGIEDLLVNSNEFASFVERHEKLESVTHFVPESIELIRGSYSMVDPAGRFFDSVEGGHFYSAPILQDSILNTNNQMQYSNDKFIERGGFYDWSLQIKK